MRTSLTSLAVLGIATVLTGCGGPPGDGGDAAPATLTQAASPPNMIIFFTDDQGWADTSVRMMKDRADSRSRFFRTPALEKMAQEGMIFSNDSGASASVRNADEVEETRSRPHLRVVK